jgi:hypothetical protein
MARCLLVCKGVICCLLTPLYSGLTLRLNINDNVKKFDEKEGVHYETPKYMEKKWASISTLKIETNRESKIMQKQKRRMQ